MARFPFGGRAALFGAPQSGYVAPRGYPQGSFEMRRLPTFSVAMACILLSACGRSSDSVERASPQPQTRPNAVTYNARPAPAPFRAQRSLGQPRLSALVANQPVYTPPRASTPPNASTRPTAPLATFTRYNGRGPGDASIPRDVAIARRLPGQGALPERDVVDVGLDAPVRRQSIQPAAPQRVAARKPLPRPIASSPYPVFRPKPVRQAVALPVATPEPSMPAPSVQVAAPIPAAPVLPPRPTIAALGSSSLSAPTAIRDATPTGLPTLRSAERAIPIGTLPASLGLANIEAAEAAVPTGDTLEQSAADEGGTLAWSQAASLIRAGEVADVTDIGEFEVLLSLCSGRGVITIQPTPTALADIPTPKVVCGKAAALTSQ